MTTITTELAQQLASIAELKAGYQLGHADVAILKGVVSELDSALQRIAELERDETKLIEERDSAEESLADMYEAATGERPEWSSAFGYDDAVEVVSEKTEVWKDQVHTIDMSNSVLKAQLEARTENQPVAEELDFNGAVSLINELAKEHRLISAVEAAMYSWNACRNTAPPAPAPVTVKLRKFSVGEVMHMSGFSRDYAEGWCAGNDNARHEIQAAGIKIAEGE